MITKEMVLEALEEHLTKGAIVVVEHENGDRYTFSKMIWKGYMTNRWAMEYEEGE